MALVWLVLGAILLVAELRHFAFYALFGAIGAFAAALVALVWPDQVALQLLAAVAVGGLGIWMVRPLVSSAFHRGGDGRLGRGVHGSLIGEEVTTLDTVGPGPDRPRPAGRRELAGDERIGRRHPARHRRAGDRGRGHDARSCGRSTAT